MALSTGALPELSFVGQDTHSLLLLLWYLSFLFCGLRHIQQQSKSGSWWGGNSQRGQFLCIAEACGLDVHLHPPERPSSEIQRNGAYMSLLLRYELGETCGWCLGGRDPHLQDK